MHTHKYPGGVRTVDTMGPDDDVLRWGGWFEAILAEARARQMDQLRRQGNPVLVSWSSYIYMGVIKSFKFRYNRFFHIHYDLEIEVIQDIAAAGGSQSFLSSISSLVNGAMSSIQTGIDQIGQSFSNVASVASQL